MFLTYYILLFLYLLFFLFHCLFVTLPLCLSHFLFAHLPAFLDTMAIFFPRYSGIGIHSYRTRLLVVVVTCCKLIPPLQTAIEMCGNNFGLEYFSAI